MSIEVRVDVVDRDDQVVRRSMISAFIFDLDGVITETSRIHALAWQKVIDEWLRVYGRRIGKVLPPFDSEGEYRKYVSGRPRLEGVESFLRSRDIDFSASGPAAEAVDVIARRKNDEYLKILHEHDVIVFPDAKDLIDKAVAAGINLAVVTSSRNGREVLEKTGLARSFSVLIDGVVASDLRLKGKPAPDTFLEAAHRLGVSPDSAAVFEDAIVGVEAGRSGGFGLVVGVERAGCRSRLDQHGADVVVRSLNQLIIGKL